MMKFSKIFYIYSYIYENIVVPVISDHVTLPLYFSHLLSFMPAYIEHLTTALNQNLLGPLL